MTETIKGRPKASLPQTTTTTQTFTDRLTQRVASIRPASPWDGIWEGIEHAQLDEKRSSRDVNTEEILREAFTCYVECLEALTKEALKQEVLKEQAEKVLAKQGVYEMLELCSQSALEMKLLLALMELPTVKYCIEEKALVWGDWVLRAQQPFFNGRYRADFTITSKSERSGFVVECDGYEFHGTKEAFVQDRKRDREFLAAGWIAIRFSSTCILENAQACAQWLIDLCPESKVDEKLNAAVGS